MRTSSYVIWASLGLALAMSACGSDGDDDSGSGGSSGSGKGGTGGSVGGMSGTAGMPGVSTGCEEGTFSVLTVPKCADVFGCVIESECVGETDPQCEADGREFYNSVLCAEAERLVEDCDVYAEEAVQDYPDCAP